MHKSLLHRATLLLGCLLLLHPAPAQVDADATARTKALYGNLRRVGNSDQFLFAQEFFNSYRQTGLNDGETASDSRDVTGAHPAVLGSDFHYFLYKTDNEKRIHTEALRYAYGQGYAITMDWHMFGRYEASFNYNAANNNRYLVYNIVRDLYGDRAWFYGELDKIISLLNNSFVVNGERIPVVLRLFHEMNGGWFWWGSAATNATDYRAFYQLAVNYIRSRCTSVLFAWSPDSVADFNYYPGTGYVDVLGLDMYEIGDSWNTTAKFRTEMGKIVDHCQANAKVAVLSETGYRNGDANWASGNYWKERVLPAILGDATGKSKKIAWVLAWMNAPWANPYTPHAGSSATAKSAFVDFKNSPNVVFGNELPFALYGTPARTAVAGAGETPALHLYPVPSHGKVTVRLTGFPAGADLRITGPLGNTVYEQHMAGDRAEVDLTGKLAAGIYVVTARDAARAISRKLVIK
ncbi:MAG: GH26 [uncultured Cytophagales bacterium]|uniref:GH26 n=1 Tax=uncultured Cytophagales bacterium TaxID=158755 RepID=A0A6J4LH58_9SPHI|nr:MAG: GH26 [uncultured Cytophagales bacterium]